MMMMTNIRIIIRSSEWSKLKFGRRGVGMGGPGGWVPGKVLTDEEQE